MKLFFNLSVDSNRIAEFNRYILEGGFPRTLLIDDEVAKRTYVAGVIDEIFEKDIKRRVKITDLCWKTSFISMHVVWIMQSALAASESWSVTLFSEIPKGIIRFKSVTV